MPTTAEQITNWQPSPAQVNHGYAVYASRVLKEGIRFEKAGNMEQARLRYLKARAYCVLRNIPYPPFSDKHSALVMSVANEPAGEWKQGEKLPMPPRPKKAKPVVRTASVYTDDTRARQKLHGKKLAAQRMIKAGNEEAARRYCADNAIPFPPFGPISGESHGPQGEPASAATNIEAGSSRVHETASPESHSGGGVETKGEAGPIVVEPPAATPALTFEAMLEKAAAMSPAEFAAWSRQIPTTGPILMPTETQKNAPASVSVPQTPVAAPVAPEPVKSEPAAPAEPPAIRSAKVFNFALNPRLARIKFLDGKQEFASLILKDRGKQTLRMNDEIQVQLKEGIEGVNAMYEQVKEPV